ncbi:hypothetical protein BD626DRAFT_607597, partial [Schizophyllum amplum]
STVISRLKQRKGGQNLSNRYRRLERSVRSKQAFTQELEDIQDEETSAPAAPITLSQAPAHTFKGYTIPDEPRPPEADECCMSGCAVCVYDLHEEALQAYKASVANIRAGLVTMGVPESQWPARLQAKAGPVKRADRPNADVSLSAFEQMERSLAAKRAVNQPGSQ